MNQIMTSISFDFRMFKVALSWFSLGLMAFFIAIAFINNDPYSIIIILCTYASYYMISIFSISDKNGIYKLYGSLPVQKTIS